LRAKSSTSRISSLYRFLWGIPLRGDLLALSLASSASASLALSYLSGLPRYSPIIVAFSIAGNLLNILAVKLWPDLGALNIRRVDQISIINSWLTLTGALLSITPIGLIGFTALLSAASFIRVTVYLVLAGRRLSTAIPLLAASMSLEAVPAAIFLGYPYGYGLLTGYLVGGMLSSIFILLLNNFMLIRGVPVFSYISATLLALLEGRTDWLKEVFGGVEERARIKVDVIALRGRGCERPEAAILVPTFHPGPFREFGSSGLIYEIADELRARGVEAIFLKGLSNHETNIIDPEDCRRIVDTIGELFSKSAGNLIYSSSMSGPVVLSDGSVRGTLLTLGDAKIVLLTRHPYGMEDIPPHVNNVEDEKLVPVDCHNSFSDIVRDLDGESLESVRRLLERAAEARSQAIHGIVAGYARVNLTNYSPEDGAGRLGIAALVFKLDKPIALIAMDGNNCLPSVRDEVARRLRAVGVEVVEVATTDTHMVNGLKLGGRGYHPLGEVIPAEHLAEAALEAVSRALRSAKPMEAALIKLEFEGVRVMSSRFFEEVDRQTSRGLGLFLSLLAASLFLGALAGLL